MYECYHIDDTLNVDAIQAHIIRFDSTGCRGLLVKGAIFSGVISNFFLYEGFEPL